MLRTILLPGNSADNRQSIDEIRALIGGEVLYYKHWESGESEIDFEIEVKRLLKLANGNRVSIVAKSAGTLLAMKAAREAGLHVERAVFLGTAVNWGIERGIPVREWLREWNVPTLFVHKECDPIISARELSAILNGRHELLVLPGNDHDYCQHDQFAPQMQRMLT